MKAYDIKLGATYLAKVSGRVVPVRVLSLTGYQTFSGQYRDAWIVENTVTRRQIKVRSPQRFRSLVCADPGL